MSVILLMLLAGLTCGLLGWLLGYVTGFDEGRGRSAFFDEPWADGKIRWEDTM